MFNIGENVILSDCYVIEPSGIERGKVYKIVSCKNEGTHYVCQINNIEGCGYNAKMFKSLDKFRKQKIKKICLRMETK